MNEKDIAYEEWAENFETPDPKDAFMEGVRFGQHLSAKQCVKVCEESVGAWIKNGAYRCYNRIKDLMA